jgi:hypothetical protein
MRILAIDPGASPGYAVLTAAVVSRPMGLGKTWAVTQIQPNLAALLPGWDLVVVEGQWEPREHDGHKARVQDILTLAFRAGVQGSRAAGERPLYRLPPEVWRAMLGGRSLSADIIYARILEALMPAERALLPKVTATRLRDCAAAIGIGWAFGKMRESERESCRVKIL